MRHTNIRRIGGWRTVGEMALVLLLGVSLVRHPATFHKSPSWRSKVIYFVPTTQEVAALTYDDGPHPKYTPMLLDILDKYHVKATFFMIGREMEKYPEIVREVQRRGHVIANHTYDHPRNIEADTRRQMYVELEKCEKVIQSITGKRPYLFRPPRGLVDGAVFSTADEMGYDTVLWTVCADHSDAPTPDLMAKRVINHIRPGAIILAHDGTFITRWKDVKATPLIIEGLQKQGYRFVTVSELIEMGKQEQLKK